MVKAFLSLYSWCYAITLVQAFAHFKYNIGAYTTWYFGTSHFVSPVKKLVLHQVDEILLATAWLFQVATLLFALFIIAAGVEGVIVGGAYFGAALLLAAPLLLALLLPALYILARGFALVLVPKTIGKVVLCTLLEMQVRRLREAHKFDIVAVVGSMDKTPTKCAIAHTLEVSGRRVQYQKGSYNDRLTVPLVLFGASMPRLFNIVAWIKILIRNEWKIKQKYPYDVAVLELGTDGPGQIKQFAYLRPELAVITSVTTGRADFFKTLDGVTREELAVANYAHQVIVNADEVDAKYLKHTTHTSYGLHGTYDYVATTKNANTSGQDISIVKGTKPVADTRISLLGVPGAKVALAAAVVADMFGTEPGAVDEALRTLQAVSGHMQVLSGVQGSILLDNTYNASPAAVLAALDVLQKAETPQHIAVLGGVNERGKASVAAHREVSAALATKKIDLLITIGQQAHDYIAVPARKRGITVRSFMIPRAAGEYTKQELKSGAVVLFSGSQSGVFAEEAIKPLLKNPKDAEKLVRQNKYWMKYKRRAL
jgi:UDP-N-acetylmuramoyl-tripeptide--D-alanyl-D-alanine ligase